MVLTKNSATPLHPAAHALIGSLEQFLCRFVTFAEPHYALPLALWVLGTFLFQRFGVFPYLVITSDTKRSGKTRLAELLSFVVHKPRSLSAITPAIMFHAIDTEEPTLFIEEAEQLASESATDLRAVINVGYRKGQKVPRMVGNEVREFKTFCPKVFILIGKPFDTLVDRSIIVKMVRADAPERFLYDAVSPIGAEIREHIQMALGFKPEDKGSFTPEVVAAIETNYAEHKGLPFLNDRDEEIWNPLFSICQVICPERLDALTAAATDISTEKTDTTIKHRKALRDAEERAQDEEYSLKLLTHCEALIERSGQGFLSTSGLIDALHDVSSFPWRKYKGTGLTARMLAGMLSSRGVRPGNIRTSKKKTGKNQSIVKGYKLESFRKAAR